MCLEVEPCFRGTDQCRRGRKVNILGDAESDGTVRHALATSAEAECMWTHNEADENAVMTVHEVYRMPMTVGCV